MKSTIYELATKMMMMILLDNNIKDLLHYSFNVVAVDIKYAMKHDLNC